MTAGERPGFMARIRRRPTAPAGDPVLVGQFVATPGAAVDQVVPQLNAHVPAGDPLTAWDRRCAEYRLVSPANRRKFTVIVVGTGLAGAGAAAALGELGFQVDSFTFHDAPRRAHSVAAQGGINAARARKVDGDSIVRFVTDTIKGGDFRGR